MSFLPKLLPYVLIHIHNKKVQSTSRRSPVQWRVETWLVVSSLLFRIVSKEGRYSLTTMADCCLIWYPFTNITPDNMWMDLGCWWGLHFMQGKYRYGCAPVQRFCTVSSRKIHPSDGRLSFLPKLLPHVLTLIQYKVSDNEFRRALAQ
jgi:hypothetical protein